MVIHHEFFKTNDWVKNVPFQVCKCRNLNLGLATEARACKDVGQEGSMGVTFHALGSAKSLRE